MKRLIALTAVFFSLAVYFFVIEDDPAGLIFLIPACVSLVWVARERRNRNRREGK